MASAPFPRGRRASVPNPFSPSPAPSRPSVTGSKEHRLCRQHSLVGDVLAAAAGERISNGSALRLIDAIRKGWKNGHVWWKRTSWAARWHVHKTTITRDYEQWTALGFAKRRPNPFKASATLLIFSWSPVWDDEVWTDHERVASLLPELRQCFEKSCNHATQKGHTNATRLRLHPLYESSKKEISKQQAAAHSPTETKTPECGRRKPMASAPSRKSVRQATQCSPPRLDGGAVGAVAPPAAAAVVDGVAAPGGGADLEGASELRDLLKQYCVRHRPNQVRQLIAAGRKQGLTTVGIIGFVVEKLIDKRNQSDPVYSVQLLINAISDPADLNHWARRARRSASFFEEERGTSAVNAGNVASDVRSYLAGCAKQLRQPEGYEEIAMELDALAANADVDLEPLEQRLSALEERMTELAQARLSAEDTSQIQGEINANLARFRAKMTAAQIDMLERQNYSKLLFERVGLPRLSLFYMRENRSRAA